MNGNPRGIVAKRRKKIFLWIPNVINDQEEGQKMKLLGNVTTEVTAARRTPFVLRFVA
jgi:hypothetical protein